MAGQITFDRYCLDLESRVLVAEGKPVQLQEKPIRLLVALLERPGRVVERAELYKALWPDGLHVDREAGLNTAVRKLRDGFRQLSGDAQVLETVPRVGYRLVVEPGSVRSSSAPARTKTVPSNRRRPIFGRAALLPVAFGLALVAALVVLGLATSGRAPVGLSEPMPADPEQRSRYLEARALMSTMNGDQGRARQLLRALATDLPEFAPAHAYLAEAGAQLAMARGDRTDLAEARLAAERALALDPRSAVSHRVLAMIALHFDWDLSTTHTGIARALELDPADPINHLAHAAYASARGHHQQAITSLRLAVDLDPDSMPARSDAGYFLLRAGQPGEAAKQCEMVLRLVPDNRYAHGCLLEAYSRSGEPNRARPHAIELLRLAKAPATTIEQASTATEPRRIFLAWRLDQLLQRSEPAAVQIATHYLELGDKDRALRWLEVAAQQHDPLLVYVPQHSGFAQMRDDPRYRQILQVTGLESFADSESGIRTTDNPSRTPAMFGSRKLSKPV